MKYLLLSLLVIGCTSSDLLLPDEYYEVCPYELKYGRAHMLQVPVTMTPHQMTYQVGDTLTVTMHFSDSIYDMSRETAFVIEDFPFEPVTLLYRVNADSTWDSGYYLNEVMVEDKYNPRFNGQSNRAADMRGFSIYEDGYYHFEYELVLTTPGNYLTVITDQYDVNLLIDNMLNAHADSIEFEEKCPQSFFWIATTIEGDPHYEDFSKELDILDKVVHYDKWTTEEPTLIDVLGKGNSLVEFLGVYCFEVVE